MARLRRGVNTFGWAHVGQIGGAHVGRLDTRHTTRSDARRVTSQPKSTQGQDRKEGTGQRYTPSFLVRRLSFISAFNFVAKDTHVWMLCAAPPGTGAEPAVACCCCCFTGVLIRCIRCIRCIRSRRHVAPEMRVVVRSGINGATTPAHRQVR